MVGVVRGNGNDKHHGDAIVLAIPEPHASDQGDFLDSPYPSNPETDQRPKVQVDPVYSDAT